MVNYFFSSDISYKPLTTSNKKIDRKPERYKETLSKIFQDIKTHGIEGVDKDELNRKIIPFIQQVSASYNKDVVHAVNNAISIGGWLNSTQFSTWDIRKDHFFNSLKKEIAAMLGFGSYDDKWNPMDIMLIKPGSEQEITKRVQEAKAEENEEIQLGKINSLFVDSFSSDNPESLILAISLKEEKSQAGKATGYFDKVPILKEKTIKQALKQEIKPIQQNIKISKEEQAWSDEQLLQEIIEKRKTISEIISRRLKEFNYVSDDISSFSGDNIKSKYGALKIMEYMLLMADQDENIFTEIIRYGLSLSKNPTFFKLKGNKDGDVAKVGSTIETYPPHAGLELYNESSKDFDGKITITDRNTNSGVSAKYAIVFTGEIYIANISIRSNQGKNKLTIQVMVEIQRWGRKPELSMNESFYPRLFQG